MDPKDQKLEPKQQSPPAPRRPIPEPPYYGYAEEDMKEAEQKTLEMGEEGAEAWAVFMASLERGRQLVLQAREEEESRERLLKTLDEMAEQEKREPTFKDKVLDALDLTRENLRYGLRASRHYVGRIAVVCLAVIGALTVIVGSVRALRVSVISFLVEHHEEFSTITFTGNSVVSDPDAVDPDEVFDPLAGLLPEGYTLNHYETPSNVSRTAIYSNPEKDIVVYRISNAFGKVDIDTETVGDHTELQLNGFSAILTEEDGYRITWIDSDTGLSHDLHASSLDYDQIMAIAETLTNKTNN